MQTLSAHPVAAIAALPGADTLQISLDLLSLLRSAEAILEQRAQGFAWRSR
jgi:hypothetical protein